jgi:hypothetical protein
MPFYKADDFSHMHVVVDGEFGLGDPQYANDPSAARVANALSSFALRPFPPDRATLGAAQPFLKLVSSHVYCHYEIRGGLCICVTAGWSTVLRHHGVSMTSMEVS